MWRTFTKKNTNSIFLRIPYFYELWKNTRRYSRHLGPGGFIFASPKISSWNNFVIRWENSQRPVHLFWILFLHAISVTCSTEKGEKVIAEKTNAPRCKSSTCNSKDLEIRSWMRTSLIRNRVQGINHPNISTLWIKFQQLCYTRN